MLLTSCTESTEPDPLQSKELQWKVGNRTIYITQHHNHNDSISYDTLTVKSAEIDDGYYVVTWDGGGTQERIRDGFFETRYDHGDVWDSWWSFGKVPSTIGEILYTDTYTRTAPDGTSLGKFVTECTTTSTDTTITVPAGTFQCMASVTSQFSLPDHTPSEGFERRNWYAPGYGYVQVEFFDVTLTSGKQVALRERVQLLSY